jgi:hypothetical protein
MAEFDRYVTVIADRERVCDADTGFVTVLDGF